MGCTVASCLAAGCGARRPEAPVFRQRGTARGRVVPAVRPQFPPQHGLSGRPRTDAWTAWSAWALADVGSSWSQHVVGPLETGGLPFPSRASGKQGHGPDGVTVPATATSVASTSTKHLFSGRRIRPSADGR